MDAVKFGAFLKTLRKEKGLTQEQLAEMLHVTNRTVSRWETGANFPDIDILITLSDYYKIDIRELLDGERKPTEPYQEKELIRKVADYSAIRETKLAQKVFGVVITGIVVTCLSFLIMTQLLDEVIGGSWILCAILLGFLIYSLCLRSQSICGYLAILRNGFLAVFMSNLLLLLLFFFTGSYHNYGIAGMYYALGIIAASFVSMGLLTKFMLKTQRS